ncbi:MAG TPA: cobalt-precorrin-7 (C(5))-methyltransferase, partial [Methanoregulaceae archaeon]|nr:cobalt-precorrin-7 (C(5))-methyltransferase [Methanoregulaceae archaeon]
KVVGVGCGPGMLTEQAVKAISDAAIIFGSKRAIALVAAHIPAGCLVREMVTFSPNQPIPDNAVILSTGDPQLAGLGYLGGEILPGISSLQVAAARLHVPLEQVSIVIAHGKDHGRALDRIADEVRRGQITFIIADPKFSITALCAALLGTGEDISIAVCEDLGYPGEKIRIGSIARPPQPVSRLFSVMVGRIECSSGDQKSH